jgi:hypothetical protein
VQAQVESRRHSGRGEDVAVVDVEDVGTYVDRGVLLCQLGRELPVRGGGSSVEDAGLGKGDGAAKPARPGRAACRAARSPVPRWCPRERGPEARRRL